MTLSRTALAGPAVLALTALAAACGSTAAPGTGIHPATSPTTTSPGTGTPADPHAAATALALRLIDGLRLPAGGRRITLPAGPVSGLPVAGAGFADMVSVKRLYLLPQPMSTAYAWLLRQRPAGAARSGTGTYGQSGRVTAKIVNFTLGSPPSWLYSATLYTSVKPASGGSLLLEQAQVQWYPRRSAADHIDPARYASVTVSRRVNHHTTSRTVTGAQLNSLAAAVNGLHAMPDIAVSCPAMGPGFAAYQLRFNPASTAPTVLVDPTGCLTVEVTVGGRRVQSLYPASTLIAATQRILRTAAGG